MREDIEKKLLLIKSIILEEKRKMDDIDFPDKFRGYRVNVNKEEFFRLIMSFNFIVKELEEKKTEEKKTEEKDLETRINNLYKRLQDYLKKIKKKEEDRKKSLKIIERKQWAIFHHGFAFISIAIGGLLGFFNQSLIMFLLIFFTSLMVIKECEHVEGFYFITRRTDKYLFDYKIYTIIVAPVSVIWGIYLLKDQKPYSAFLFAFFMTLLLSILFFVYQKQIEEDREKARK